VGDVLGGLSSRALQALNQQLDRFIAIATIHLSWLGFTALGQQKVAHAAPVTLRMPQRHSHARAQQGAQAGHTTAKVPLAWHQE
jgi:hypothetical protein